jgi:hypothetical protein
MRNEIFNEMFYQVEADSGQVFVISRGFLDPISISISLCGSMLSNQAKFSSIFGDLKKIVHDFV